MENLATNRLRKKLHTHTHQILSKCQCKAATMFCVNESYNTQPLRFYLYFKEKIKMFARIAINSIQIIVHFESTMLHYHDHHHMFSLFDLNL